MNAKKSKRDSETVDRLISEVDRLTAGGMSINRACAQTGIQPTVYYFRKRRDIAILKPDIQLVPDILNATQDDLIKRYGELDKEMREIQMELGRRATEKKKA